MLEAAGSARGSIGRWLRRLCRLLEAPEGESRRWPVALPVPLRPECWWLLASCCHATTAPLPAVAGYRWLLLLEVLDEGDDESALREKHSGNPLNEPELEIFEVGFRSQGGDVKLFEGFGDTFRLRVGKSSLFELLDDAVRVDHQGLHTSSVYRP